MESTPKTKHPVFRYTIALYRHFLNRFFPDDGRKPGTKEELLSGCLANEIGLALIVLILAPFIISLVATSIFDILSLPLTLWRRYITAKSQDKELWANIDTD